MKYDPYKHDRRSIRLKNHDYASAGCYFVTICTREGECLFGEVVANDVRLNKIGAIAKKCWELIPLHFEMVALDEFQVMPNHIHGILRIVFERRDVQLNFPTNEQSLLSPRKGTLSVILRTFKAAVTTVCKEQGFTYFRWQSRFHDHIVRSNRELQESGSTFETIPSIGPKMTKTPPAIKHHSPTL